jgi:hypothetical protein
MSDWTVPLNHNAVEELLRDPTIIRIVTVVNLSSLSILELLEYDLSREDINRAMAKGVIAFDKSTLSEDVASVEKKTLGSGDYYFKFLGSKVRLTELGLYILETIGGNERPSLSFPHPASEEEEMPVSPRGPIF